MKYVINIFLLLAAGTTLVCNSADAQTQISLSSQSRNIDFRNAPSTSPLKSGTILPALCQTAEMFFKVDAAPGANIFLCVQPDMWQAVQGSGGGAALNILQNTIPMGARSTLDALDGVGITRTFIDTGTKITDQIAINTAVIPTRVSVQSNADRVVALSSSGTCAFAGTLSPVLPAYPASAGMEIFITPNRSCDAAGTLNLNALGPKNLYESNGITPITVTSGQTENLIWDPTLDAAAGGWKRPGRTMPFYVSFISAVCQGTIASLGFSTPTSGAAVSTCVTGANTQFGVAQFADGVTTFSVQGHFPLPPDWVGAIDISGKWRTAGTTGSVVWQVQTACVGDGETSDPAWNSATPITDLAKSATLQQNDFASAGITVTGCAAGDELYFKFLRDPTHGSDDLAATAELINVTFLTRRAI